MILRVKKRGDGQSALPTVRFEGKRPLVKGAPGSFLGGSPGAVAPPASFNVQEVPAQTDRVATPLRARVMGGGGWFAGCLVRGRWGEGGGR